MLPLTQARSQPARRGAIWHLRTSVRLCYNQQNSVRSM